ncbi:hypothetical protein CLOM_g18152 [Closterium sp. NIES-68]|nr:hypothetical protein CLOM_g18152 [Closterium sp. NIES-68]GJP71627.1 hypothetical protein CLOP_g2443 [Closterium sp. NIES-67]
MPFQSSFMVDDTPRRRLQRHQFELADALLKQPVPRPGSDAVSPGGSSSENSPAGSEPIERLYEAGLGSCGIPDISDENECVTELAAFPELHARSGSAKVRQLACLAHNYLRPWMGIPGVKRGMGAGGMISPKILHRMGRMANVLSCAGHVRIVNGEIFFRFGGFEFDWYRMRRFVFSIRMIKEAISMYKLHSLNAEFFLSTCDLHISKAASIAKLRAGLPIFSPHGAPGSIDILYPDPVDLSKSYFRDVEDTVLWEQKQSRAVFRGGMTNFHVTYDMQWRASPRFRVHKMSDVRPDLLDAKVVKGIDPEFTDSLREDDIEIGGRLGPSELQGYKYELDVDGGTGSGRVCGVLSSNQMLIKQASEYTQFFDPLLCPNRHFVPTHRYFSNLYAQIEWARDHDKKARRIVKQANRLASDVCTWEGRRLYWAILLVKYSASALEDPANVTQPITFQCNARPTQDDVENSSKYSKPKPAIWIPRCQTPDEEPNQPPCTHFCAGPLFESKWKWLTADLLDDIEVFKPRNDRIEFRDE